MVNDNLTWFKVGLNQQDLQETLIENLDPQALSSFIVDMLEDAADQEYLLYTINNLLTIVESLHQQGSLKGKDLPAGPITRYINKLNYEELNPPKN